ncbi:unnamed protein product [Protopolystoma xenopodis]|uniref:Uncharacterized protein n=1 Tax=Protopolystoma xenopodis TaxID=117903 RepID=A0A3S5FEQ7_9PLAT|nr:unnamed protein product [Protopolystoma xenopodis]
MLRRSPLPLTPISASPLQMCYDIPLSNTTPHSHRRLTLPLAERPRLNSQASRTFGVSDTTSTSAVSPFSRNMFMTNLDQLRTPSARSSEISSEVRSIKAFTLFLHGFSVNTYGNALPFIM